MLGGDTILPINQKENWKWIFHRNKLNINKDFICVNRTRVNLQLSSHRPGFISK